MFELVKKKIDSLKITNLDILINYRKSKTYVVHTSNQNFYTTYLKFNFNDNEVNLL